MTRSSLLIAAVAFVATFSGCHSPGEQMMIETIDLLNEMTAALDADASPEKLKSIQERMTAHGKRMQTMKISDAEQKQLRAKYETPMMDAVKRLAAAGQKYATRNAGKMFSDLPAFPGGF